MKTRAESFRTALTLLGALALNGCGGGDLRKSSNQQMTLSTPWPGPTGTADLKFHHDQHNYCVQFEMPVE